MRNTTGFLRNAMGSTRFRLSVFLLALTLFSTGPACESFAAAVGDFAPLAVGNAWTYAGEEQSVSYHLRSVRLLFRRLSVDSMNSRNDSSIFHLTCRDSLHAWSRSWFPDFSDKVPDSVVVRRFRIVETAGKPLALSVQGADPLPWGIAPFFKSRTYPPTAIHEAQGAPAGVLTTTHRMEIPRVVKDSAVYGQGLGLLYAWHDYNVWNAYGYTAPMHTFRFTLTGRNGKAVDLSGLKAPVAEASESKGDFLVLEPGLSWRYAGLRRLDSLGVPTRDSILRNITVTGFTGDAGPVHTLVLRDSLFGRLKAGIPVADRIDEDTFTIQPGKEIQGGAGVGIGDWNAHWRTPFSDMSRFFVAGMLPAELQVDLDLPQGTLHAMVYLDTSEGLLADTMTFGDGIGLLRRHKVFFDGLRSEEDFVLTGFRGKTFAGLPVQPSAATRKPASRSRPRERHGVDRRWRDRDLLGKKPVGRWPGIE